MVSLEQDYPWITRIHQGFSGQHTANLARVCSLKLAHSDTTELQLILCCTVLYYTGIWKDGRVHNYYWFEKCCEVVVKLLYRCRLALRHVLCQSPVLWLRVVWVFTLIEFFFRQCTATLQMGQLRCFNTGTMQGTFKWIIQLVSILHRNYC